MFETLADRVRVYIDSAHDVTEAAKTIYRSLAATNLQNLWLPAFAPGVGAKLDIYLLVPRADLESSKFEELRQFGMLVDATSYWP